MSPRTPHKTAAPISFEEFHAKYGGFVMALAYAKHGMGDVMDQPEDIAQDVMLTAWQHSQELLDSNSCYGWLRQSIRFRMLDSRSRYQRAMLRVSLDAQVGRDRDGSTLGELLADQRLPDSTAQVLQDEVYASLRPRERTLVTLLNTGYGVSESAHILGVAPDHVRQMLKTAALRYYSNLDA